MTGQANKADLTDTTFAMIALLVFILAYSMVIAEEFLHMRKSKPVMLAAGVGGRGGADGSGTRHLHLFLTP